MTIKIAEIVMLDAKLEGDCTGMWIAESKYYLRVAKDPKNSSTGYLQLEATLDLDFEKGGSIFYKCGLVYTLSNLEIRTKKEDLIEALCSVHHWLNRYFVQNNLFYSQSITVEPWTKWGREEVSPLVDKTLIQLYP